MNYFLLKCPKCGNQMKYHTSDKYLVKKRKICVYCGHSYDVKKHIINRL